MYHHKIRASLLGVTAMMIGVAGCGSNKATTEATTAASTASSAATSTSGASGKATPSTDYAIFKGKKIGIISLAPGLEPVDRIQGGVTKCVADNGGTTQVFDAKGGTQATPAFEQANAAGVDAIYNVANDVSGGALDAQLKAARDAKRPVVTAWGGQRSGTYSITGLEFQSAARVGQYVIDRLAAQNKGVAKGTVLIVNARVTPSLRQRADAFKAMVGPKTEFPDIKIVEVEVDISNALADTQAKVEQAIQANPEINAVYASFDTLGEGAAKAVDSAKGSQFVVSFNGDSTALEMIRAGGSFAATAANDLEGTAVIACNVLAELLAGKTPAATTFWMDSPLVTGKNIPKSGFVTGAGPFELYQP